MDRKSGKDTRAGLRDRRSRQRVATNKKPRPMGIKGRGQSEASLLGRGRLGANPIIGFAKHQSRNLFLTVRR
jgi:hypothetical protein